jgi:cytochrome c
LRESWRALRASGTITRVRVNRRACISFSEISMTRMTVALALAATLAAAPAWAALDRAAGEAMMKKYNCSTCHAIDKKLIGPAYQDVAAKYAGDKDAPAKLARKVKEGGSGVWGSIPMPPNSTVPDADIKQLVDWILTLKK